MNNKKLSILLRGIIKDNPVLILILGTCPTLAVTGKVSSAISMGIAATLVLICSNIVISALRKVIPDTVRVPCYIVIIAGFVTSFLGGSKVNITGPTAAFATIVAGIILNQGMDGLFLATIMAGILLVLMGLLRVGSLIKYIPHTITVGFTSGIAVTLAIGQLKDFLGLTYPAGTVAIETTEKLALIIEHFSYHQQHLVSR